MNKLKKYGFKKWNDEVPKCANVVYVWSDGYIFAGVGRTALDNGNSRVNPNRNKETIKINKDAGKTFIAAVNKLDLYWKEDTSEKTSRNASIDELFFKQELVNNKFISFGKQSLSKVEYMTSIIIPLIKGNFGENSNEFMLTELASGDGDLWSRFKRNKTSHKALNNILNYLID